MRRLPLDEQVDGDLEFDLDSTQALRIKAIGTDSGTPITPKINGDEVGAIVSEIANIHTTGSDEQGPMPLDDLYYYVPPDGRLELDGAASDTVRLVGERLDDVTQRFPQSSDETRFNQQGYHHYTFEEGSVQVSEPLSDNQVETVHTIQAETDEQITVDFLQSISQSSDGTYTTSEKEISVFWELDGQRLPGQFASDDLLLVDLTNMPRPPNDTTESMGFSYMDFDTLPSPLTVNPDQNLDVRIRNVSGGSLGSGGDTSTFTYTARVIFDERR